MSSRAPFTVVHRGMTNEDRAKIHLRRNLALKCLMEGLDPHTYAAEFGMDRRQMANTLSGLFKLGLVTRMTVASADNAPTYRKFRYRYAASDLCTTFMRRIDALKGSDV